MLKMTENRLIHCAAGDVAKNNLGSPLSAVIMRSNVVRDDGRCIGGAYEAILFGGG